MQTSISAVGKLPAELRTYNGCSDSYIERLAGGARLWVVGDEELAVDQTPYLFADAVAFVAHDDDAMRCQGLRVDILSVE